MVPNVQVCREPGHSPPPLLHQPLVRAVLVDRFVRSACAAYLPVRMRHTRRQSPPRSTVRGIPPAAPSPSWPPPRTFAATPHDAQGTVESYVGNCRKKCSWSGRRTAPGTTQGPARPERWHLARHRGLCVCGLGLARASTARPKPARTFSAPPTGLGCRWDHPSNRQRHAYDRIGRKIPSDPGRAAYPSLGLRSPPFGVWRRLAPLSWPCGPATARCVPAAT